MKETFRWNWCFFIKWSTDQSFCCKNFKAWIRNTICLYKVLNFKTWKWRKLKLVWSYFLRYIKKKRKNSRFLWTLQNLEILATLKKFSIFFWLSQFMDWIELQNWSSNFLTIYYFEYLSKKWRKFFISFRFLNLKEATSMWK